jgi:Tfp pilus assembly protein PilV
MNNKTVFIVNQSCKEINMMEKLIASMILVFGLVAFNVHADTMKDTKTSTDKSKSVQTEKNNLPDSRATGDYLKDKPANNTSDMDKSIRTEEDPEDGGMDLESK